VTRVEIAHAKHVLDAMRPLLATPDDAIQAQEIEHVRVRLTPSRGQDLRRGL
jgi:hypothetical protein